MTEVELPKISPIMVAILSYLSTEGKKTQRQLIREISFPTRSIRYSLRILVELKLLKKIANLSDMRSDYYGVAPASQDYI